MDNIFQQLNHLKEIEPSQSFKDKSKGLVLRTTPRPVIEWRSLVWAGAFGMALVMLVAFKSFNVGSSTPVSLNTDNLNKELKNMSINIQLKEITYQQNVNQTIAVAIDEITNDQIKHLNQNLLESEKDTINFEESGGSEVDKLLEKVLF